jgi:hypothetical protein
VEEFVHLEGVCGRHGAAEGTGTTVENDRHAADGGNGRVVSAATAGLEFELHFVILVFVYIGTLIYLGLFCK